MENKYLLKRAAIDALATALYVFLISQIMKNGDQLFGKVDNKIFAPMVFLLTFIFSALVTGYLILGKPIMMYLDGQKKEALRLLFYTGAALFIIMILGFALLISLKV
ncbi:MAG TPA: hypothetical protein VFF33_03165 [Ignavibacteriaceae bacterium]|nr:hypothetical protein [Ignavibacteriaceae bacterium]